MKPWKDGSSTQHSIAHKMPAWHYLCRSAQQWGQTMFLAAFQTHRSKTQSPVNSFRSSQQPLANRLSNTHWNLILFVARKAESWVDVCIAVRLHSLQPTLCETEHIWCCFRYRHLTCHFTRKPCCRKEAARCYVLLNPSNPSLFYLEFRDDFLGADRWFFATQ